MMVWLYLMEKQEVLLWSDSTLSQHRLIKEELNKGGVDVLGMSADILLENPTDGYKGIEYALTNNPDITVFLSMILQDILMIGTQFQMR